MVLLFTNVYFKMFSKIIVSVPHLSMVDVVCVQRRSTVCQQNVSDRLHNDVVPTSVGFDRHRVSSIAAAATERYTAA